MKSMRTLTMLLAAAMAVATVSCEREESAESFPYPEIFMLGKWAFPIDSSMLWSGRSMTIKTKPLPTIEVDSVAPMRWDYDGDQITAMREDSNRVWKFQFRVLDITDTSMNIEGAYGYVTNVNGSQWSNSGIVGHSWTIAGMLSRDSNDYILSDER